jgi:phosphoserine phosphatase
VLRSGRSSTSSRHHDRPAAPISSPPAERLAVFDNDGTLWAEQPIYTQLTFAFDRARAMAPQHPEWATVSPSAPSSLVTWPAWCAGEKAIAEIVAATHTGMTPEAFRQIASTGWPPPGIPRFGRPYTECVYQPMLEVLALFRARGFRTCIVSGGTTEFMRPWAERVYGVPPDQVVGTTFKLRYG